MLQFENDYQEGAHTLILERLLKTNNEATQGYGFDPYTLSARKKVAEACGIPDADVFFISGGTQTNQLVISTVLKPYEAVVAANTGHVNGHEAGAIEYTGHRVVSLPGVEGKLEAKTVKSYLDTFFADGNHDHMTFPGMVYVSHPTEYGTLYTKDELTAIADVCHEYKIPLYLDGARLGYALVSPGTDLSLPDIASICDVFYIGGTKVGALLGEAVVFTKHNLPPHFMTQIKQHGALLAKGRVLGIQFDTLFTDDLYTKISRNAIMQAEKIRAALREKNYRFFKETVTNQIFIVLDNETYKKISEKVLLGFWEKYDESHSVVRIATSWATTDTAVKELISIL